MFFSENFLEKKKEALRDTITTGFFSFILGGLGTLLLSAILYGVGYSTMEDINASGKILSTISLISLGYMLPVYFMLLLGLFKMLVMMLHGLWIFLKYLFVSAEKYNLENEPNFRV